MVFCVLTSAWRGSCAESVVLVVGVVGHCRSRKCHDKIKKAFRVTGTNGPEGYSICVTASFSQLVSGSQNTGVLTKFWLPACSLHTLNVPENWRSVLLVFGFLFSIAPTSANHNIKKDTVHVGWRRIHPPHNGSTSRPLFKLLTAPAEAFHQSYYLTKYEVDYLVYWQQCFVSNDALPSLSAGAMTEHMHTS